MKKRMIAILLTFCMVVMMMPLGAMAATSEIPATPETPETPAMAATPETPATLAMAATSNSNVWIGGQEMVAGTPVQCGADIANNYAVYDSATNTLTLHNATITSNTAKGINVEKSLTKGTLLIQLEGENFITTTTAQDGIFIGVGNLTINAAAAATLTIVVPDGNSGIMVNGDTIIGDNVTINATGGIALHGNSSITLQTGSNVTVQGNDLKGGSYSGWGLYFSRSIIVESGAVLQATGAHAAMSFGKCTINGQDFTNKDTPKIIFDGTTLVVSPAVLTVTPAGNKAPLAGNIVIRFDQAMNAVGNVALSTEASSSDLSLTGGTWSADKTTYTVAYQDLAKETTYTVKLTDFVSAANLELPANSTHTFTTIQAPLLNGVPMVSGEPVQCGADIANNYAVYDIATNTLTLHDATINRADDKVGILAKYALNIKLVGQNNICSTTAETDGIRIGTLDGSRQDLDISAASPASLTVSAAGKCNGLMVYGNTTVGENVTLNAAGSNGIDSRGTILLAAASTVTAQGHDPEGYGLVAADAIRVTKDAKLTAIGEKAAMSFKKCTINEQNFTDKAVKKIIFDGTSLVVSPAVLAVTPAGNKAPLAGDIVIRFNQAMNAVGNVALSTASGDLNLTGGTWSADKTRYTVAYQNLAKETTYTVKLTDFVSATEEALPASSTHTFTTMAEPAVWVNGVNIITAPQNTVACGEGKAVYEKGVLTLTNAVITEYHEDGNGDFDGIYAEKDLTINLVGTNTILAGDTTSAPSFDYGVVAEGSLTLLGSGSLAIRSDWDGIYAVQNLLIGSNVVLAVDSINDDAIYVDTGDITIKSGAKVTANGTHHGIRADEGSIVIERGVTLVACSVDSSSPALDWLQTCTIGGENYLGRHCLVRYENNKLSCPPLMLYVGDQNIMEIEDHTITYNEGADNEGTAKYDVATNTLVLDGADITTAYTYDMDIYPPTFSTSSIYADGDLNLVVTDGSVNLITNETTEDTLYVQCGIHVFGKLNITGRGALDMAVSNAVQVSAEGISADALAVTNAQLDISCVSDIGDTYAINAATLTTKNVTGTLFGSSAALRYANANLNGKGYVGDDHKIVLTANGYTGYNPIQNLAIGGVDLITDYEKIENPDLEGILSKGSYTLDADAATLTLKDAVLDVTGNNIGIAVDTDLTLVTEGECQIMADDVALKGDHSILRLDGSGELIVNGEVNLFRQMIAGKSANALFTQIAADTVCLNADGSRYVQPAATVAVMVKLAKGQFATITPLQNLWVGDSQIVTNGVPAATMPAKVSYAKGVLTLTDYTATALHDGAVITADGDLTICLVGKNNLVLSSASAIDALIACEGALQLTGTGTLTGEATEETDIDLGIAAGTLAVADTVDLTLKTIYRVVMTQNNTATFGNTVYTGADFQLRYVDGVLSYQSPLKMLQVGNILYEGEEGFGNPTETVVVLPADGKTITTEQYTLANHGGKYTLTLKGVQGEQGMIVAFGDLNLVLEKGSKNILQVIASMAGDMNISGTGNMESIILLASRCNIADGNIKIRDTGNSAMPDEAPVGLFVQGALTMSGGDVYAQKISSLGMGAAPGDTPTQPIPLINVTGGRLAACDVEASKIMTSGNAKLYLANCLTPVQGKSYLLFTDPVNDMIENLSPQLLAKAGISLNPANGVLTMSDAYGVTWGPSLFAVVYDGINKVVFNGDNVLISEGDNAAVIYCNGATIALNGKLTMEASGKNSIAFYAEGESPFTTKYTVLTGGVLKAIKDEYGDDGMSFFAEDSAIPASLVVLKGQTGGGGGGGGGGAITPQPEPSKDEITVVISVQPVTKNNVATATVSDKAIDEAIQSAADQAGKTGGKARLEIRVDTPQGAKTVETTLSGKSLGAIGGKTEGLKISSGVADLSFDKTALAAIAGKAGTDVQISMVQVDPKDLTATQKSQVGNGPVFDLTILSDGKIISDFGGGAVTVSLPYTLQEGEKAEFVTIWLLGDDGNLVPITATYADGRITFKTTHFSRYAIGYLPFTDVPNDWAYGSIVYAYNNQLFAGVGETKFAPTDNMTRSMLWTVLYRMAGSPAKTENTLWYADAQAWAMTQTISDGSNPDGNITREQLATVLYRYAKGTATGADMSKFSDTAAISDFAKNGMNWAVANGILQGDNGKLNPQGNASRAEVAAMLQRFAKMGK